MFPALKNHPFGVEAFFDYSLTLTFAIPKEELENLIPECLVLDDFNERWAFIAVAMVKTKALRPKGFSECFGNDFFLIGYRIFVRYTTENGKRLRGLYILKSETDKRKMKLIGNVFTHYNYHRTDVSHEITNKLIRVNSTHSGLDVSVSVTGEDATLPEHSPFNDWREARRFAGPMPFTFTYQEKEKTVLLIEGVRQNWKPEPVVVQNAQIAFLDDFKFSKAILANAFVVKNVPYHWKKGVVDKWLEPENH